MSTHEKLGVSITVFSQEWEPVLYCMDLRLSLLEPDHVETPAQQLAGLAAFFGLWSITPLPESAVVDRNLRLQTRGEELPYRLVGTWHQLLGFLEITWGIDTSGVTPKDI